MFDGVLVSRPYYAGAEPAYSIGLYPDKFGQTHSLRRKRNSPPSRTLKQAHDLNRMSTITNEYVICVTGVGAGLTVCSVANVVYTLCLMYSYSDFSGVIFDIDDTLLDNKPAGEALGLHELSRLMAAQEVGKRHDIAGLKEFTGPQSAQAFADAKVHTVYAAVWQMLVMAGVVLEDEEMDLRHPLLQEVVTLKEELHEDLLRTRSREVPGAGTFVASLADHGFADKMAIASTACRRDIDVFFEISGLGQFFSGPPDHIPREFYARQTGSRTVQSGICNAWFARERTRQGSGLRGRPTGHYVGQSRRIVHLRHRHSL